MSKRLLSIDVLFITIWGQMRKSYFISFFGKLSFFISRTFALLGHPYIRLYLSVLTVLFFLSCRLHPSFIEWYLPLPITILSRRSIPTILKASFKLSKIDLSSLLGVGSPEGWLCTRITDARLFRILRFISYGKRFFYLLTIYCLISYKFKLKVSHRI